MREARRARLMRDGPETQINDQRRGVSSDPPGVALHLLEPQQVIVSYYIAWETYNHV
jgi:hypothetical protein